MPLLTFQLLPGQTAGTGAAQVLYFIIFHVGAGVGFRTRRVATVTKEGRRCRQALVKGFSDGGKSANQDVVTLPNSTRPGRVGFPYQPRWCPLATQVELDKSFACSVLAQTGRLRCMHRHFRQWPFTQ